MPRPIWKGQISFGLVNIPITLFSAERRQDLKLHLVDSRNGARVRYNRVNDETGEEVPWDSIVKAFHSEQGDILLTEEELEQASAELTKLIEIEQFVELADVQGVYFDKPYYVVPGKGGEKGYVLLREAMQASGKTGIARVVIRSKQYLSALSADGDALVLNLLRFEQDVVPVSEFDVPGQDLKKYKVTAKEVELAKQLVSGMTSKWNPGDYHDDYREALLEVIEGKISSGHLEPVAASSKTGKSATRKTINFMDVLKRSVAQKSKPKSTPRKPKTTSRKKRTG
ncbi:non-homologous end joining protein Ku [Planctomicrobium piriforme]|nr:Ku protein [Planctomicrobium piriforme]